MSNGESTVTREPIAPLTLILVGVWIVLAAAALVTPADADLWGHLTFGRDIIHTGHVVTVDDYAFTSDRPWINHEWLAEVIFFQVYRHAGAGGLILFKLVVIALLLGTVWRHLRRLGAYGYGVAGALVLAFISTYWRTHNIRPQLFSVLLFAVLLCTLARADSGRWRGMMIVPPLMALWANLHGGWIVGCGVLVLWAGARAADSHAARMSRVGAVIVACSAFAATLLTPYGIALWHFLAETVRPQRVDTEDWNSIATAPLALGLPWLLTMSVAVWAIWRSGWRAHKARIAIVAGLAVMSLRVSRLDAFFGLSVVILLAGPAVARMSRGKARMQQAAPPLGMLVIGAFAIGAVAIAAARVMAPQATCLTISGAWAPDLQAGRFITANRLQGRMLTWYSWGEYAIWHFGPGLQVSIDGRRETVYSERTLQAHWQFYADHETGLPLLRLLAPDYIWLPTRLPVNTRLLRDGWTTVFSSPTSMIFAKVDGQHFQQVADSAMLPRCFPGP